MNLESVIMIEWDFNRNNVHFFECDSGKRKNHKEKGEVDGYRAFAAKYCKARGSPFNYTPKMIG